MALSPVVYATLQGAVLSAISNVLAQVITAYRTDKPFIIDWVPVFQFILFTFVQAPPNYLWQQFLEESFPGYHVAPTAEAVASAAAGDDKALDREASEGRLVEPRLNVRNTLIKTVLDQTAGGAVNTLLFSVFMQGLRQAMRAPAGAGVAGTPADAAGSLAFLLGRRGIRPVDYARVDWAAVWARARAEFWTLMASGWTFWPFVSLVNFAFVKTVPARNLVGSLAGMGWGVYVSLFTAGN